MWRAWIAGCLNSARVSILLNGAPTEEFTPRRGIRQGDALAPFLFIIAMEGLNVALNSAVQLNLLKGIPLPNNGPTLSHLFYADDVIIVGKWSGTNLANLLRILNCFHLASGLKMNLVKSELYGIGVEEDAISTMANRFNLKKGTLPFTFLGLPVGSLMSRLSHWKPLVDKFRTKLAGWKASTLSIAGRRTLCKSVLGSIGIYYLSVFKAPEGVYDTLEKIRKNFFWGFKKDRNKTTWVSWSLTRACLDHGGMGIGSLKAFNISLLLKWWWRLKQAPNSLWASVITAFHSFKRGMPIDPLSSKKSGVWGRICSIRKDLSSIFGNGFIPFVNNISDPNAWVFKLDTHGTFSVASARKSIDDVVLPQSQTGKTIWLKRIPGRVNIFLWRLALDRLPTRFNLSRRNISVNSLLCPLCGFGTETIDHLFVSCRAVSPVWSAIGNWCRTPLPATSVSDTLRTKIGSNAKGTKEQILASICAATFWVIWKHRNKVVFEGSNCTTLRLFDTIRDETFWWIKARATSNHGVSWESWNVDPLSGCS